MRTMAGDRATRARGALLLAVGLSGGLGAFSDVSPTGHAAVDAALVGFAAAVTTAVAFAAPAAGLIVAAALAAGASGTSVVAIPAWMVLGFAIVAARRSGNDPLRLVLGVALAQVLLRLPSIGFDGLPTLVALAAFSAMALPALWSAAPAMRRRIGLAAAAVIVPLAILGFLVGRQVLDARSQVDDGIAAARRGLDAARAGDTESIAPALEAAEASLATAGSRLDSWPAAWLRYVPIAGHNYTAVREGTRQGRLIAAESVGVITATDLRDMQLRSGSIDLDAIGSAAPDLAAIVADLDQTITDLSQLDSPWLLPLVSNRIDELVAEVEEVLPDVRLAADAAAVVPDVLGASAPRNYFVIFGTPAESREFGGFFGSWGLVRFDDGTPTLVDSGRYQELVAMAQASGFDDTTVSQWYVEMGQVTTYPQNVTADADMRTVAAVTRELFADAFDEPIDGLIYLDQWALIDLIGLIGEVTIPGRAEPLTVDNAADYFFREQYETVGADRTELFDGLAEAASAVLTEFQNRDLPGPEALGRLLGPAARGGRLQIVTFDEEENEFFQRIHLLRSFDDAGTTTSDFVGLIQANGTASKLDLYLERDLEYVVERADDGTATADVTVTLRAEVPQDAPPYTVGSDTNGGVNEVLLSLYTPGDLTEMWLNGDMVDPISGPDHNKWRHLITVEVPPDGREQVIQYGIALNLEPGSPYTLEMWHQPLVNTDTVTVRYQGPDGAIDWSGDLVEDLFFTVGEDDPSGR